MTNHPDSTIAGEDARKAARGFVDAIVEKDREDQARPAQPYHAKRKRIPELVFLMTVLAITTGFNIWRWSADRSVFTPGEEEALGMFDIAATADAIETFRRARGHLPASLAEAAVPFNHVTYRIEGESYVLQTVVAGSPVTYRGGSDLSPFTSRFDELTGGSS